MDTIIEKDIWYAEAFDTKAAPRFDVYFEKGISAEGFDPTAVVIVGGLKTKVQATWQLAKPEIEVYFTKKSCKIRNIPGSVTSVVEF